MDGIVATPCPGFLAGWRLRPGVPPESLDEHEAGAAIIAGERGLWLHLDLIDQRTRELIAGLPLPDAAKQILLEPDDAPHLDLFDAAIAGALADLRYDAEPEALSDTVLVRLAVTADLLITARRHPLQTGQKLSKSPLGGSAPEVFGHLLRGIAESIGHEVHRLAGKLASLEDGLLRHDRPGTDRRSLADLRRAMLRLERMFAPTAEMLATWSEDPEGEEVGEPFRAAICREERRHAAVHRALASLQERARILQDQLNAMAGEETNRRLFVLSVLSAALLPASVISGIFGMNVGSVPGVDKAWGFPMAMGLIVFAIASVLGALRIWKLL